jgi:hypothetical protein
MSKSGLVALAVAVAFWLSEVTAFVGSIGEEDDVRSSSISPGDANIVFSIGARDLPLGVGIAGSSGASERLAMIELVSSLVIPVIVRARVVVTVVGGVVTRVPNPVAALYVVVVVVVVVVYP